MIVIFIILLVIISFSALVAPAAFRSGIESDNNAGCMIGVTFVAIIIICLIIWAALPDIKPTCTLDGLM